MFMLKYIDFYSRNMDLIFGQVVSFSPPMDVAYLQKLKQDWILHDRIPKMLFETFFFVEAHAVLPQEDSKGNSEFEG